VEWNCNLRIGKRSGPTWPPLQGDFFNFDVLRGEDVEFIGDEKVGIVFAGFTVD
jgi:hypothetical protein